MNERNGNILLRFLFELNKNPKEHRLFLLGDIFDLWISDGSAFAEPFRFLAEEIGKLQKNGGQVYYFEGNHDVHVDRFWTRQYGVTVFDEMQYMPVDQMQVRIEHGDYINPNDLAYFKYLSIIRHPWVEKLGHYSPSRFWHWVGHKQSKKSRSRSTRYTRDHSETIRQMIRTYAEKVYQEKPFDLIITGHMHVFDDYQFEVNGKKARSINLGTWLERPRVLKIQNNQIDFVILD